jgi:hypothetical protein
VAEAALVADSVETVEHAGGGAAGAETADQEGGRNGEQFHFKLSSNLIRIEREETPHD